MLAPGYIQVQDQGSLGIPDANAAQIAHASQLINSCIGKPKGLLWSPDASGNPAWMTLATPERSFKAADDVQPGQGMVVATNYGSFGLGDVGTSVLIDRKGNPEACIILAATGNTLTLSAVQFAHAAGSSVEMGMTIAQEAKVINGNITLSAVPVVAVLGITGTYIGDCRNPLDNWLYEFNSSQGYWDSYPVGDADIDLATGSCRMTPTGFQGYYARVRANYIAGWSYDALPYDIKLATAAIVRNGIDSDMPGNVTVARSGNAMLQRASATKLDPDIMKMLDKYRNYRL